MLCFERALCVGKERAVMWHVHRIIIRSGFDVCKPFFEHVLLPLGCLISLI